MMKRFLALMLAMLMVFSLAACGEKKEEATGSNEPQAAESDLDENTIYVATPGSYTPFTIYDETKDVWDGFEIELWRTIAEKNGMKVEFVRLDNPATFAELDLNRVDTVAKQISITPARQEKYDFTQPFFFSPYTLVVAGGNTEINTWADMAGRTIGLNEGSAMNEFVAALDPENKVIKNTYDGGAQILDEVSLGRVDATPYAYLVLPYFLEKHPEFDVKPVDVDNPIYTEVNGYPFARTERGAKLLKMTNDTLSAMMADGSYAELSTKWFGIDVMQTTSAKKYFAGEL